MLAEQVEKALLVAHYQREMSAVRRSGNQPTHPGRNKNRTENK